MHNSHVVVLRQTCSSAGNGRERGMISTEDHGRVQVCTLIFMKVPEKAITTRDERAAAVLFVETQVGEVAQRHRPTVHECRSNGARAQTDEVSSAAIAADADLHKTPAHKAGVEETRLALEGHADGAWNRATPQQSAEFVIGGPICQLDIKP